MQVSTGTGGADRSIRYDMRQSAPSPVPTNGLDDLAETIRSALNVPLAVIAFDDGVAGQAGVSALAGEPWVDANRQAVTARLADPRVAGALGLSFYASVPLRGGDRMRIGTLAVLGRHARAVSEDDLATLTRFAKAAEMLTAATQA